MRRTIFFIFLFVLMGTIVNAQSFRAGIGSGVDMARFAISGASGGPLVYKTDLAGGVFGEVKFSPTVGLQLEVSYSPQGSGVIEPDGSTAGSYQLNYLTIPLMVKLYANPKLSFLAGPQVGILMNAKTKSSGDPDTDVKDQLESSDFYAVFGTEYRFTNGIFVSGRYNLGLQNIIKDKSSNTELKNRYLSFRIGYSFSF